MAFSRYSRTAIIQSGKKLGTNRSALAIRRSIESGIMSYTVHVCKENERLDVLAGRFYGDARYWWVLASASGIGWAVQVPPGTRIVVPDDIAKIEQMVG